MASNQPPLNHLIWATGGALVGAWWIKNQTEESKKSRAEKEDAEGVEQVCGEIAEVLDAWEPDDLESEDDYTEDLFEYLCAKCVDDDESPVEEVSMCPDTPEGKPDILIDDRLVLELKVNPNKAERDRCIGQCAAYSREWVTWIVLIDTPMHKVREIEQLLEDKGLGRILVFAFN
jgi:hypothetical protein